MAALRIGLSRRRLTSEGLQSLSGRRLLMGFACRCTGEMGFENKMAATSNKQ
jgi:hypothetical protein